MSDKTIERTEKPHLWKKGQSGNLAGRPPGSRNKTTIAVQALLQGQAEKLTQKAIESALEGDMAALKLCIDRIVPAIKELPLNFKIPTSVNAEDLPKITSSLLKAVSSGEILPTEAEKISKLISVHREAIELADFDSRLKALEQAQTGAEQP